MDARMQRLHAAVHHLRHAGDGADVGDGEPGVGKRLRGAAGREDLDAVLGERAREVDDAGLVGDGDQRAPDRKQLGAGDRDVGGSRHDALRRRARRDQDISDSRHFTGILGGDVAGRARAGASGGCRRRRRGARSPRARPGRSPRSARRCRRAGAGRARCAGRSACTATAWCRWKRTAKARSRSSGVAGEAVHALQHAAVGREPEAALVHQAEAADVAVMARAAGRSSRRSGLCRSRGDGARAGRRSARRPRGWRSGWRIPRSGPRSNARRCGARRGADDDGATAGAPQLMMMRCVPRENSKDSVPACASLLNRRSAAGRRHRR